MGMAVRHSHNTLLVVILLALAAAAPRNLAALGEKLQGLAGQSGAATPTHCAANLTDNLAPQVIIAGAPKCGSTALHAKLCTHPVVDCEVASKKEPNTLRFMSSRSGATIDQQRQEYLSKAFRGATPEPGTLTIDGSIWYYYYPQSRARMRKLVPCSKLMFVVRNPVHRARSNFFHSRVVHKTFQEYIALEAEIGAYCHKAVGQSPEDMARGLNSKFIQCVRKRDELMQRRIRNRRPHSFWSSVRNLYPGYWVYHIHELRKYHKVLVIPYDDFASDAVFGPMLDGVAGFLGLPPFADRARPPHANHGRKGAQIAKLFANSPRQRISVRTQRHLTEYLHPQADALYEMLGRRLNWTFTSAGDARANQPPRPRKGLPADLQ